MSFFGLTALEGQPLIAVGTITANGRLSDRRRQLRSHIPAAYTVHKESNGVRLKTLKAPSQWCPFSSEIPHHKRSLSSPTQCHKLRVKCSNRWATGNIAHPNPHNLHGWSQWARGIWRCLGGHPSSSPYFYSQLAMTHFLVLKVCTAWLSQTLYNLLSPPSTFPSFPSIKVHSFSRGKKRFILVFIPITNLTCLYSANIFYCDY